MISSKYKITQKAFTDYIRGKHVPFSRGTVIITNKTNIQPGFAVVVSKKVASKAYQRNIIKRFYYNFIQKNLDFFLKHNTSVVIVLKSSITNTKLLFNQENKVLLEQEMEKICLKK